MHYEEILASPQDGEHNMHCPHNSTSMALVDLILDTHLSRSGDEKGAGVRPDDDCHQMHPIMSLSTDKQFSEQ